MARYITEPTDTASGISVNMKPHMAIISMFYDKPLELNSRLMYVTLFSDHRDAALRAICLSTDKMSYSISVVYK